MSANRSNIYWHLENQIPGEDRRAIGMVYEKIVEISAVEIKALNGTPKELVAAPGAGKLIEFVGAVLFLDYGSETLTETSSDGSLVIEYDDGSGSIVATAWDTTAFIVTTVDTMEIVIPILVTGVAASGNVNKNLALTNNGTDFTGNASDDTIIKVAISYRIHDFNTAHPRFS